MNEYNLLDESWIPVLYRNGCFKRVGILKALKDAHLIKEIAASNPMDRVAILRFLLALLYWCKGSPPDDANANNGDSFPEDWFSKLDNEKGCFNLLGEERRFYQNRNAQRSRAATDLLQEIPTGNNFWHFRHSTDGKNGLCLACCTMGLLRLPLFSVSGLPDLKAGINGTPPVYVVPWGESLLHTLMLNWVPAQTLGQPAWVQPDIHLNPDSEVPLLTGLTLLSRRVWLHHPEESGACTGCGTIDIPLIRTCEFQTAGDQKNERWKDPHVIYSEGTPRKASMAQDLTAAGKFKMDRPWPDLLARIVQTNRFGIPDRSASLFIVGFATDKAKNIDVWERFVEMPAQASAIPSKQWMSECHKIEKRIDRSLSRGKAAIAAIRPHVEDRISSDIGRLATGSDEAWEQAAAKYRPMMRMVARSLAPGFTTEALRRRRTIQFIVPNMKPKPEPVKKDTRKKGGASE